MCPEVVQHFTTFPSFAEDHVWQGTPLPLQTTDFAVRTVCTLKVVQTIANSVNAKLYLHAGSHLGAVVHGQPIAWDDDADAFMDFDRKDEFVAICETGYQVYEGVVVWCEFGHNAIKVWMQIEGMTKETRPQKHWWSPYVDLFLYKKEYGLMQEVNPKGKRQEQRFPIENFFPAVPYYFGGLIMSGPQPGIAAGRYRLDVCRTGEYNHRLERYMGRMNTNVNCTDLARNFPFRTAYNQLTVGNRTHAIFGIPDNDNGNARPIPLTNTSIEERDLWASISDDAQGKNLTDQLPNLNAVEVDNTIAPHEECSGTRLRVIEYNAERGRWWKEAADVMKDYDVIILNEMDIGMARSDQQHTTRLMAQYLGMNYAWGLEFVELTVGDSNDRKAAKEGEKNIHGLHGNAFLTKCKITDPVIFRDNVGPYFSNSANGVNGKGLEKRLGGRMAMLGRINFGGEPLVVGSVHKWPFPRSKELFKDYIGSSSAVIAGDEDARWCSRVGLTNIVSDPSHTTWPASCSSTGRGRGDIICSNMKVVEPEDVILPCVKRYGLDHFLSDHAFTWVTLAKEAEAELSGPGKTELQTPTSGQPLAVEADSSTLSAPLTPVTSSAVLLNSNTPVLQEQDDDKLRNLKFYIITVPFLTTDLLVNGTERAKIFYARSFNEDRGEMWVHRGLMEMSYEQGHTMDPNEADVFFIPGYNNFRFSIYKRDFPRGQELDEILRPHIFNKTKPHFIATPRTRERIGVDHMVKSLTRLGVNLHSLGYERNTMWQTVPVDRIVPVPYVVSPQQSKVELQRTLKQVPRTQNYTFFAGDSRPLADRFCGCNREHLLQKLTGTNRSDMSVSLSSSRNARMSQEAYNHRMQTSEYCLVMCGDTPTSRSLASAMMSGCIPIIVGSRWRGICEPPCHPGWGFDFNNHSQSHLPYPNRIDWSAFPEVSEAEFAENSVDLLQEIFRRQSPQRRDEVREAMGKMQLAWVYGWGNPVDSEELGEAVPAIWESVKHHLVNF